MKRRESVRYAWQLITIGGNIHILFCFLFDEPKASAFWTSLTVWISNISMTVTIWTDFHAIFFRIENLFVHFSPPPKTRRTWNAIKQNLISSIFPP